MHVRRWIPLFVWPLSLVVLDPPAAASPKYASTLSSGLRKQAHNDLVEHARAAGVDEAKADLLFKYSVVATSSDTRCPGVDVDIVNATDHTVWNVELEITQTDESTLSDKSQHTDKVHVPYLPANTAARAQVECYEPHRSSYYGNSGGIGISYIARGAIEPTAAALDAMRLAKTDYYLYLNSVLRPTSEGKTSRLVEALELEDADVATQLVQAIGKTGVGVDELAAELSRVPNGPIAEAVAASLDKAPAAVQVGLARALLASPSAELSSAQLLPLIDRLCRGKRVDVVKLAIAAAGEHEIPADALRERVRARCVLTPADGAALAATLDDAPARAGEVLDAAPLPLFNAVVGQWRARPSAELPARLAFLRDTESAARFDPASATVPKEHVLDLLPALITAPEGPAIDRKVAWLRAALERLAGDVETVKVVTAATEAMMNDRVRAPAMKALVHDVQKKSPGEVATTIAHFATPERSPVFDLGQLPAQFDPAEFLGFTQRALLECDKSLSALQACLEEIATYQNGELAKIADKAVRTSFSNSMSHLVGQISDFEPLLVVGKQLDRAGFSDQLAEARACSLARTRERPGDWIDEVAKVKADAPCIAEIRELATGEKHRAIWLTIFGLLGLIAPYPIGVAMIRRRYRKLQSDMPKPTVEAAGQGIKLADRLGERGLGRGLRAAVGAAAGDLSSTPAGHALASIDTAVLWSIGETVSRAVKTGDAATQLLRHTPDALYIVALPVRHARPQIVQRYLGAPWPEHVAAIQRAAQTSVVSLVVLCGPEASEARLVVGFTPADGDPRAAFEPESLLDAREARERGAQPFCHVMTLGEA